MIFITGNAVDPKYGLSADGPVVDDVAAVGRWSSSTESHTEQEARKERKEKKWLKLY